MTLQATRTIELLQCEHVAGILSVTVQAMRTDEL